MKLAVRDRIDPDEDDTTTAFDGTDSTEATQATEITESTGTFGTTESAEGDISPNPDRR